MTDQLLEAGILLSVGMTVVFSFLTLLIGGIHGIAWFARTFPEPQTETNKHNPRYNQSNNNNSATQTTVSPTIVAAITAAVNAHRQHTK
ncbi:MAG: OadG family protein [Glaciecola sp.]